MQQVSRVEAPCAYLFLILETEQNKLVSVQTTLLRGDDILVVHKAAQVLALVLFLVLQICSALRQTDTARQALPCVSVLTLVPKPRRWLSIALSDVNTLLV